MFRKILAVIAVSAACFTELDLKNARCDTYCKLSSYEFGYWRLYKCVCAEEKPYDNALQLRPVVPIPRPTNDPVYDKPYFKNYDD